MNTVESVSETPCKNKFDEAAIMIQKAFRSKQKKIDEPALYTYTDSFLKTGKADVIVAMSPPQEGKPRRNLDQDGKPTGMILDQEQARWVMNYYLNVKAA